MNTKRDPLDEALASLPKSVQPTRDLWSGIRAEIESSPRAHALRFLSPSWLQLAAGVLLVIATSATTYFLTRESPQNAAPAIAQQTAPAPLLSAMPASFGAESLGADYFKARAALDAEFEQRIAALPPATRAKIESNLADLRRAANEIATTLAQHPSDPLLQDLLMSTYQSELQLFANVNEMTTRTLRTDL
jgi:SRSO17 transposase